MRIKRLEDNPIITPKMFGFIRRFTEGRNINGPTLIKVPEWIKNPLGKYYLYFGNHGGQYIRLAYSESVEGPYKIHKPGTLHNEWEFLKGHHIASPEIYLDDKKQKVYMYFHANIRGKGIYKDQGQMTFVATSDDGIDFTPQPQQLAPFYLRVFPYEGYLYGIAKNDNMDAVLVRTQDITSQFERGHQFLPRFRHCALYREGDCLNIFFTRAFDKPEVMLFSQIDLSKDWSEWDPTEPEIVLKPERDWEGANLKITQSNYGGTRKAHALRDPNIYTENGKIFLLYSVKGEKGIAIAEIENL